METILDIPTEIYEDQNERYKVKHKPSCSCNRCKKKAERGSYYSSYGGGERSGRYTKEKVKYIQRCLNKLFNLHLKIDGDFGKKTKKVWKEFQFLASGADRTKRTGRLNDTEIAKLDKTLKMNQKMGLPMVFTLDQFEHNKDDVIKEHREKLCSIASLDRINHMIMKGKINMVIFLGHADPTGSRRYNSKLSAKRAGKIRDHFMTATTCVNPLNIQRNQYLRFFGGFGEEHQLPNKPHEAQRRVEIIFLKFK